MYEHIVHRCITYRDPVVARPGRGAISNRAASIGERGNLVLAGNLGSVGNVHLVVVVLILSQHREKLERNENRRTPWVEEKGMRTAFSGPTIMSTSDVAFSLNVSGIN